MRRLVFDNFTNSVQRMTPADSRSPNRIIAWLAVNSATTKHCPLKSSSQCFLIGEVRESGAGVYLAGDLALNGVVLTEV